MKQLSLDLYKKMFLIRMVEEKIREYYSTDEIKTPTHLAIGSEAIATGVIVATQPHSQIFGTYRNHGIYLAKTGELDNFFGELFGKMTGLSKGKAGSMHIMSPDNDFMGTSAIVGSTIPLAVGAAYANSVLNNKKITISFFGDGAVDEGAFWESINYACVRNLPVIFICEDNELAIHSWAKDRHGYKKITDIISGFNCHVYSSVSTDVETIYELTKNAIAKQKKDPKPVFIHLKYYRYLEHVGPGYDFKYGYRSEDDYKKWVKIDPITLQRKRLVKKGFSEKKLTQVEIDIIKKIDKSIVKARKSALPPVSELLTDVTYE